MSSIPRSFLEQLADRYELSSDFEKPTFVERMSNMEKSDELVARMLNISRDRYSSRMTKVYQRFRIPGKSPGKAKILYLKVLDIFQKEYPSDATSIKIVDDAINKLVNNVQIKTRRLIHERCGYMQILDMSKPIDVQDIFTEVRIKNTLTSKRHIEISDLVKEIKKTNSRATELQNPTSIIDEKFLGVEVIKHTPKLMIFGSPGAGKTTLLKHTAVRLNRSEIMPDRVPVFISLKDFQDQHGDINIQNYIFDFFKNSNVVKEEVEKLLLHSKIIFLLDGLDEVSDINFSKVIKEIKELVQRFGHNKFIITCRLAAHEYKFENFIEAEVCDFTDEQINSFVRSWFNVQKKPYRANRFLERIANEVKIKELASNPLLLTLLCIVFSDSGDFPQNRAELYEEGLDVLLRKWDASRDIDRHQAYKGLSKSRKEDLLSQIAYITFEENEGFFKHRMIEDEIRKYIRNLPAAIKNPQSIEPDCKAILRSIISQHGIIQEVAKGIYSFSHRTFHEYFVSRKIVKTLAEDQKKILEQLANRITDYRWREVFLLVACTIHNADALVLSIKEKIDFLLMSKENPRKFLAWLEEKTLSLQLKENPNITGYSINSISQIFYFNLVVEANTSAPIISDDFVLDADLMRILNHGIFIQRSESLVPSLSNPQQINETKKKQSSSYKALVSTIKITTGKIRSNDLKEEIESLEGQLPRDSTSAGEWWGKSGKQWISNFRSVLIRYRNIGHEWNFSSDDLLILQNYFNANRILFCCLNSDCYVSREVREEIKKSTLLPINKNHLKDRYET